jgi:ribosomal protein L37AE/L43A
MKDGIPCNKCHRPMNYRALSGIWWCPKCEVSPPMGTGITFTKSPLYTALTKESMNPEYWNKEK